MIKPKSFDYFDGREASKEIGIHWSKCHFAKGLPGGSYAILGCDDEELDAWQADLNDWPEDTEMTINQIEWIKYFRSLGYRDQVVIKLT